MSTPLVQQPSQPITLQNPRMSRAPGPHLQHSFDLPFHLPHHHQPPPQPAPAHSSFSSASGLRKGSGPPLPPAQSIRTSPPGRSFASPPSSLHSSNSASSMASPPPNMYGIAAPYPPPQQQPQHFQHQLQQPQQGQARRTLSNATSNSSNSQNRTSVRRSSSNRSSGQHPTSYVALLRKQKATVWCDRSQAEDPRILAAQRLAKERAEREVTAGPGGGSHRVTPPNSHAGSFTSGVARKIRHHGAQKLAAPFAGGGNLAGAGVPLRLSSTEIDDDEDELENDMGAVPQHGSMSRDDDWGVDANFYGNRGPETHRRTGSGRSSNGSRSNTMGDRYGTSGSMSANGQGHHRSTSDLQMSRLDEKTPVATDFGPDRDYFNASRKESDASSPEDEEERERREDELRRRGSVDDRAMTMSGVRLFVANPDLDD